MFDKYNIGHLYKSDFEDGLNKLGVFAPRTQVNLLFRKLDKDSDGKLRFAEFCSLICPYDKIYKEHLNNKRSNYEAKDIHDAFTFTTKLDFSDLIRKQLRSEGEIENMR
jgi:hypothetical protein